MSRRLALLLSAFASTAAGALEPDQVQIAYLVKAGAHQISGVSHQLEWRADALDGERTHVQLRVPIASFDSGHPEFDAALRLALDAAHHPFAIIDGIADAGTLSGTLELAGIERPISMRLSAERVHGNVIAATAFTLDLAAYGIALPGVSPKASIDAIVRLTASPNAILAGGLAVPR